MKTNLRNLRLIMMLMLLVSTAGLWAQGPYPSTGAQTVCLTGSPESYGVINTALSSYAWTIDGSTTSTNWVLNSSSSNQATILWINAGTYTVQVLETNGAGCVSPTPVTVAVTVNPTPDVTQPGNQIVCNAAQTSAVNFTGSVAGTVFNWTNSNESIGLAATGTGDISAFIAINNGTTPIIANITVTPAYTNTGATCTGTPQSFTITVNPTSTVASVSNLEYCNSSSSSEIIFTSPVSETTFTWTTSDLTIGLAASGIGNLPSFTATNTGTTPVVATITVTPTANSCVGTPLTFTITVNPTPTVVPVSNVSYCNGSVSSVITFTSPVLGTTYSWTTSDLTIGLEASGTGNLPSFTATNVGTTPVVATITVTPSANDCVGTAITFTITINPLPATSPIYHN